MPRCRGLHGVRMFEDGGDERLSGSGQASLSDEQIAVLFGEFDTDGSGFIDLGELQAALAKAGRPVSLDEAEDLLKRVDSNNDGQISREEFRDVFQLEPSAVPDALKKLFDVSGFFLNVGEALGIEVRGQWRTTPSGSKFVDDVLGNGKLLEVGDVVLLHYTVTLMSSGAVVESSRGGKPLGFDLGEAAGDVQGWNDAVVGMRVGGQRRVYARPQDGEDGPTARYDIEIMGVEAGSDSSAQENLITSLGGRRAAARLLFALTFVPYFLPEEYQPDFFKPDFGSPPDAGEADSAPPKVDKSDLYVSKQLDALFANEVLPSGKKAK